MTAVQANSQDVTALKSEVLLRVDIAIEGFKVIKSVPIELSGVRSYELTPTDDNPIVGNRFDAKGNLVKKKDLSILVNVKPAGN